MRRVVVSLVLSGLLLAGVQPAMAQQFGYQSNLGYPNAGYAGYGTPYGGGYGYTVAQPQYPVMQKVIVGGTLIGLGFAAGRATAPQGYYNSGYGYRGSSFQGNYGGYGGHHHNTHHHGGHHHSSHHHSSHHHGGHHHHGAPGGYRPW